MSEVQSEELDRDKTLCQMWFNGRNIRSPRINTILRISFGLALPLAIISCPAVSLESLYSVAIFLSDNGVAAGLSLLGLLLAGYVVFVTVSRRDFLVALAISREKDTKLPHLNYVLYPFIVVLVELLVYSATCMLFSVLLRLYASSDSVAIVADGISVAAERFLLVFFVILVYASVHILVSLKSMIRNVHYTVVQAIRWEIDHPEAVSTKELLAQIRSVSEAKDKSSDH